MQKVLGESHGAGGMAESVGTSMNGELAKRQWAPRRLPVSWRDRLSSLCGAGLQSCSVGRIRIRVTSIASVHIADGRRSGWRGRGIVGDAATAKIAEMVRRENDDSGPHPDIDGRPWRCRILGPPGLQLPPGRERNAVDIIDMDGTNASKMGLLILEYHDIADTGAFFAFR
ncbi:MAG: hypothetical protein H6945_15355 [Zoogloeaceae bacterium]|nr:hypothetical protein [Rhodocyclaceae bacterium]MCP5237113.1 hypothetical protein [Zoogloeaceae bacterium]